MGMAIRPASQTPRPISTRMAGIKPMQSLMASRAVSGCSMKFRAPSQLVVEMYPVSDNSTPNTLMLRPMTNFWPNTIHAV